MQHPLLASSHTKTLDDLVMWGVAKDLYLALTALNLYDAIADNAVAINDGHHGQTFFGSVQDMAFRELSISLSRMYEVQSRNKLRSIPAALDYMSANASQLRIFDRNAIFRHFSPVQIGLAEATKCDDATLTQALTRSLQTRVAIFPGNARLRVMRDKHLAHHEFRKNAKQAALRLTEIDEMIAFALDFVDTVGEGYIGTNCTSETAPHYIVEGAARPSFSLHRLLKELGVEPSRAWIEHENDLRKRVQTNSKDRSPGPEAHVPPRS
jgi:hypothetical protein